MDNETAKIMLSACRSDGADAQDPVFADALKQARLDPQLGWWFAQQRAIDRRIAQELKQIEAPASAKELVVTPVPTAKPSNLRRHGILLLVSAALVVISGIVLVGPLGVNRAGSAVEAFQKDALAMVAAEPAIKLDLVTSSLPETRAYIAKQQGPLAPGVPVALQTMKTVGCRVTEWHHHRMSLTCFLTPGNHFVHLVVLPKEALANARLPEALPTADGWRIAYRERDGMVMFWATHAPVEQFLQILQS